MTETTIIPPADGHTAGFHAHEGSNNHRDVADLILLQQSANEGRSSQKSAYDAALDNRDAIERHTTHLFTMTKEVSDHRRETAQMIEQGKLETVKAVEKSKSELDNKISDLHAHIIRMDERRHDRELADAKSEILLLKLKLPA